MIYKTEVDLNPALQKNLTKVSDRIIYAIAKDTLRQSESVIPMRTGKMRNSSMKAGVKGSNSDYYIGSYTGYAKYVWKFPDNTHWTTSGTNNKWFARVWEEKKALISKNAVGRNKL